jgi:hypothetical protein
MAKSAVKAKIAVPPNVDSAETASHDMDAPFLRLQSARTKESSLVGSAPDPNWRGRS